MSNSSKRVTRIHLRNASQSQIATVQRHIEENARRVSSQRELLVKFQQLGLPTGPVESLLAEYETALALYRQDLEAMLGEQTRAAV